MRSGAYLMPWAAHNGGVGVDTIPICWSLICVPPPMLHSMRLPQLHRARVIPSMRFLWLRAATRLIAAPIRMGIFTKTLSMRYNCRKTALCAEICWKKRIWMCWFFYTFLCDEDVVWNKSSYKISLHEWLLILCQQLQDKFTNRLIPKWFCYNITVSQFLLRV